MASATAFSTATEARHDSPSATIVFPGQSPLVRTRSPYRAPRCGPAVSSSALRASAIRSQDHDDFSLIPRDWHRIRLTRDIQLHFHRLSPRGEHGNSYTSSSSRPIGGVYARKALMEDLRGNKL